MPKSICTTFFQNDAKVINFLHKLQNKFLVLNFCEIKANLHTVKSTNIKRDLPVLLTWYTANLYTISFSLSFSMLDMMPQNTRKSSQKFVDNKEKKKNDEVVDIMTVTDKRKRCNQQHLAVLFIFSLVETCLKR